MTFSPLSPSPGKLTHVVKQILLIHVQSHIEGGESGVEQKLLTDKGLSKNGCEIKD